MTFRVKCSSLLEACISFLQFHYSSMFGASYLMKLNVIITCFVSGFLCVILLFLLFLL